MCSACASSSPAAVNSAAEQSARSLMFGLNAAAPQHRAHLVGDRRKSRARGSAARPGSRAPHHPRAGRSRRGASSPRGSTPCSRVRRPPPGPRTAARGRRRQVVDRQRRRARDPRPQRDDLDRRTGSREAVAPLVLGREVVDLRAPSARGSDPRSDSRASSSTSTARDAARATRSASVGAAPPSRPLGGAGRRPRTAPARAARVRTAARPPRTPLHAAARRPPRMPEPVGHRARVERTGTAERHQREVTGIDALLDASPPAPRVPSPRPPPRPPRRPSPRRAATRHAPRRPSRRPKPGELERRQGCRPSTRLASVTVAAVPPRP